MFFGSSRRTGPAKRVNCVSLVGANQVVRALPPTQVPLADIYPKGKGEKDEPMLRLNKKIVKHFILYNVHLITDITPPLTSAYLEVTDLNTKKVKYIPVPR